MYGIIYKATNKINGKVYIGQTTDSLASRRSGHMYEARHRNRTYFYHAINKYGSEGFIWEQIAEATTKEELDQLEIDLINQYNSTNPEKGYNGKEGGSRGKNSEATRKKISETVRASEKFKKAMTDPNIRSKRASRRIGEKHSEETKEKMSKSSKGHHRGLGVKKPEFFRDNVRQRVSGAGNPNVFPFLLKINEETQVWEKGFPELREYLLQKYRLDIALLGLYELFHKKRKYSAKAKKQGIELDLLPLGENNEIC